jgi:Flp pilus assembly protein TadB
MLDDRQVTGILSAAQTGAETDSGPGPTKQRTRSADGHLIAATKEGPVPLSEHEQRLLDEIEQALYAEDPKFASAVRSARGHRRARRSVVLCIFGVLVGLGLVLVGLLANVIVLSVVGFVLVVSACGYGVQSLRARSTTPPPQVGTGRNERSGGLRSRMEERMRRRFDEN